MIPALPCLLAHQELVPSGNRCCARAPCCAPAAPLLQENPALDKAIEWMQAHKAQLARLGSNTVRMLQDAGGEPGWGQRGAGCACLWGVLAVHESVISHLGGCG